MRYEISSGDYPHSSNSFPLYPGDNKLWGIFNGQNQPGKAHEEFFSPLKAVNGKQFIERCPGAEGTLPGTAQHNHPGGVILPGAFYRYGKFFQQIPGKEFFLG